MCRYANVRMKKVNNQHIEAKQSAHLHIRTFEIKRCTR